MGIRKGDDHLDYFCKQYGTLYRLSRGVSFVVVFLFHK